MIQHRWARALAAVAIVVSAGLHAAAQQPPTPAAPTQTEPVRHPAIAPAERTDSHFQSRHASFNKRAQQGAARGDIGIIFLGDSITQGWEGAGRKVWDDFYAKRSAVNMGIGGDRTQHVLWRLEHGNVDGLAKPAEGAPPRLVVLMIGTNNSNGKDHTAEQIADGVRAIVTDLRARLPETKVLLLGIFPRGEKPNAQREKNAEASRLASAAADGRMVHYLDISSVFTESDGTISKDVMPDSLHLSEAGYRRWADAMEPKVAELLAEPPAPPKGEQSPTAPSPS